MVLNGAIYNQSIPIFKNETDSDLFGANLTTIQALFGTIGHPSVPLGTLRRSLPKPKYFSRNQEPAKKKVSVLVPGLTISDITGYWLGTWF